MHLSFDLGPGERPDAQSVSKLSTVLAAAQNTAVYRPLIARRAPGLAELPPIGIHGYIENKEMFRNPKAAPKPLPARPSAAKTLAGSAEELLWLAVRVGAGEAQPPASARRVTVRTPLGERLASERTRDCFWRAFELPVFEELVGSDGETLGFECEGHSGMHLDTQSAIFEAFFGELVVTSLVALRYPVIRLRTGWVGAIEQSTCPCGERVTRFVPVVAAPASRKPPIQAPPPRRASVVPFVAVG
jgi:hypothetical protein